jgi:protein-S-isoprenylcysteine O-methyltransferase Ste14
MNQKPPTKPILSYVLVFVQFGALSLLGFTIGKRPPRPWEWIIGGVGVWLGLWALHTMRPERVSVFPEVQVDLPLVTDGVYRWMRHPMYTSLLLIAGIMTMNNLKKWRVALYGGLVLNQLIKSQYEERLLATQFAEYALYRQRTKRFIPFIF